MFGILKHKSRTCKRAKPKQNISIRRKNGLITTVTNKSGKKPPLYGAETDDGYRFYRSDVKNLNDAKTILVVKRNPENAMIRLAKDGHKKVQFLD